MTGKRILLIEDDKAIARMLRDNLHYEGFAVEWLPTGRDASAVTKRFKPDLVLLDLSLPEGPMVSTSVDFSQGPDRTPVIIITARGSKEEHVRGLSLGADDYVVKPFALSTARAGTRSPSSNVSSSNASHIRRRRYRFSAIARLEGQQRHCDDGPRVRSVAVSCGAGRRGCHCDELLRLVWGYSDTPTTRTVDNFIFRLRHKLEPDPHHPRLIRTAHGDGYRFTLHE
jgi:DNA-binding response OmpR family regulator